MKGLFSFLLVLALGACVQGLPNPFLPCPHYPGAADRSCGSLSRVVLVEGDKRTMRPEVHQSTFCVCPKSQPCSSSLGFNPALPVFQEERAPNVMVLIQPGFCGARDSVPDCSGDTLTLEIPVMNPAINFNQYCRCPSGRKMLSQAAPQDQNGRPSLFTHFICPE